MKKTIYIFQSTHPSWGATDYVECPLPDCGISIHAPLMGCDAPGSGSGAVRTEFQSTHPSWGATAALASVVSVGLISIHAPLMGCDRTKT